VRKIMEILEFQKLLTAFADAPTSMDFKKGEFLLEIRDEIIEGKLLQREGNLIVQEGDDETPAMRWIINRIARLQLLAERILTYIPNDPYFVVPNGTLLDTIDDIPACNIQDVDNTVDALKSRLDNRIAGTTFLCYLTSDAGEGKSTLINHLARSQAESYKRKETDWLLLPVPLGGRTLLRFDDVMIGTLVNRLRFPLWYYDALIELVRLGVIIPALDGFEEMFIESATGEAVSALGNFVRNLRSSGTVLIAARKAYFEFKSFETQARLYDTIDRGALTTARISLKRWEKSRFLQYAKNRQLGNGEEIYNDFSSRLSPDHPVLTRAVLIARLVEVASSLQDRNELINRIGAAPQEFYTQFIKTIVDREIHNKWIDRSGEPHKPLLNEEEHYFLLSLVSEEMWVNNTDSLSEDTLDLIADMFCEQYRKPPQITMQIKERLKQHALIVRSSFNRGAYSFDHEEFRSFFLGRHIAKVLLTGSITDVKRLFEPDMLSNQAADIAVHFVKRIPHDITRAIALFESICQFEGSMSFIKDNSGLIAIRLLDGYEMGNIKIENISFPSNSLKRRTIKNIEFKKCYFQPTSLEDSSIMHCIFDQCLFERIDVCHNANIAENTLTNTQIQSLGFDDNDFTIYDPDKIKTNILQFGFKDNALKLQSQPQKNCELDNNLSAAQRLFRAFLRATEVNENLLKLKVKEPADRLIEVFTRTNILEEDQYRGAGQQRRFRLTKKMAAIEKALHICDGTLDDFIDKLTGEY
jgi:hypothetical protein